LPGPKNQDLCFAAQRGSRFHESTLPHGCGSDSFLVTRLCLVTRFPEGLLPVMDREAESRRAGMCSQAELGNKVASGREPLAKVSGRVAPQRAGRASRGHQAAITAVRKDRAELSQSRLCGLILASTALDNRRTSDWAASPMGIRHCIQELGGGIRDKLRWRTPEMSGRSVSLGCQRDFWHAMCQTSCAKTQFRESTMNRPRTRMLCRLLRLLVFLGQPARLVSKSARAAPTGAGGAATGRTIAVGWARFVRRGVSPPRRTDGPRIGPFWRRLRHSVNSGSGGKAAK